MRVIVCLFGAAALCNVALLPAKATPVGEALHRPAIQVQQPARAALLAAARAGARIVAVGERGVVIVSDDGGTTWRQSVCPVSVTLTSIRFIDAKQGVAVGHGGTVLTTTDAGSTWTVRMDGRRLAQLALQAAKDSGDGKALKDAERLVADGPDKPLLDVLMFNQRRLLAVGAYGIAVYSEDGGQHWEFWGTRFDNPRALHIYAVRRSGDRLLLAGEQGLLLSSDDGGTTFKRSDLPYKGSLFVAEMLSPSSWVVGGLRGNVWRSDDGGVHWSQSTTPTTASITASTLAGDGTVLLASQDGKLMRLREDVASMRDVAPLAAPSQLLLLDAGKVLSFGLLGVTAPQGAIK